LSYLLNVQTSVDKSQTHPGDNWRFLYNFFNFSPGKLYLGRISLISPQPAHIISRAHVGFRSICGGFGLYFFFNFSPEKFHLFLMMIS
jgi:hypothetical protein